MKVHLITMFAAALAAAQVHAADDAAKKPAPKKAEAKKAEATKSGGSDKNVFQKAESGSGKFLNDNKLWTQKK